MGLIILWRSLFFISGVAVRFTIDKAPLSKFLLERSTRLFVPLAFGNDGDLRAADLCGASLLGRDPAGLPRLLSRLSRLRQYAFSLPDLHHLWYVAAILAYTLLTAACLPVLRAQQSELGRPFFGWLAGGGRGECFSCRRSRSSSTLRYWISIFSSSDVVDWAGTARTLTFFLIGFMAAKNEDFWRAVDHALPASIGLSLVLGGLLLTAWLNQFEIGADTRLLYAALLLRPFYAWSVMVMLLGLARRFANRPSRALTYLTAGVFPYYILHQTIIVVVGYWFTMHEAPLAIEAATIVAATVARLRPWL